MQQFCLSVLKKIPEWKWRVKGVSLVGGGGGGRPTLKAGPAPARGVSPPSSLNGVLSISPQVIRGDSSPPGTGDGVATNP